ncbi:DUF4112 domain-containing protein [Marinimicrobium sp. C2-29]|uniref:DUF4112 domain-containing protein n=1 Tax=Marinimicrobium sp. C2-29 TaxID=3139825 RepID=UPI0031391991
MNSSESPNSITPETLAKLQKLSRLMDKAFVIPGTGIRFGVDSIVGLIPVVGDSLTAAVSGYIYSFSRQAGVPWHQRLLMIWNIFIDWLIGLIPFFGDIFDVGFKANSKNVDIITTHVERQLNTRIVDRD